MPFTKLDWEILARRVAEAQAAARLDTRSKALLWLVLEQNFPDLADERIEAITDGADDRGIDAVQIVESEEFARVCIYQAKYREEFKSVGKTVSAEAVLKVCQFLTDVFDKSSSLGSCGNLRLREAVLRIWALHARGVYCRYEVVFCSNDGGLADGARQIMDGYALQHSEVSYLHYGPEDIMRYLTFGRGPDENGQLQVIGREIFDRTDGDIRGLIASVDAGSFLSMISTSDGKSVKRHLFDENLRVYLGSHAGYNSEIIETATSESSHLFWYLNNGITITCKRFSYNKVAGPIVSIEGFQIVNGAQTSHSLVEANNRNPEALANVVLTIRVYETHRADIAERVAVATNSQARIQSRDLKSNSAILRKLEIALAAEGYYLERKRNMHADKDPSQKLDALKLGQIVLSFYLRSPDKAKTESDSIFDSRFSEIFNDSLNVMELARIIKIYAKIEWLREDFSSRNPNQIENTGDYQYLIYGNWFILYACRVLLMRDNAPVPEGDEAALLVERAITLVARACNQSKAVAHYQMFRSPKTREKIIEELSGKQTELFEFL